MAQFRVFLKGVCIKAIPDMEGHHRSAFGTESTIQSVKRKESVYKTHHEVVEPMLFQEEWFAAEAKLRSAGLPISKCSAAHSPHPAVVLRLDVLWRNALVCGWYPYEKGYLEVLKPLLDIQEENASQAIL